MYLIYAEGSDFQSLKASSKGMKEDVRYLDGQEYDKDGLIDLLKTDSGKIDGIAYVGDLSSGDLFEEVEDIDPDICQIAVVEDPSTLEEYEDEHRLHEVYQTHELVLGSILRSFRDHRMKIKTRELCKTISSCEDGISIYLHDDPDMDAIASAMAFEKICEEKDVGSNTYYGGTIGPTESEIFLDDDEHIFYNIDQDSFDTSSEENEKVVFLDFGDPCQSDNIPEDVEPDVIIDHHGTNKRIKGKEFTQIRSDVGATATLMTQHLINLDMDISPTLASALLVGIKIDTSDYTKNISSSDYRAITYLNTISDKDILDVLENPPIYSETFTAMGSAIFNRRIKEDVLTAFCREVHYTEGIAQIADLLLRERDILTVLVYGVKDENIHMSARSKDLHSNMGEIMKNAFSDIGEAGGHPHAAGGKIPLDKFEDEIEASEMIEERFYDEVFDR